MTRLWFLGLVLLLGAAPSADAKSPKDAAAAATPAPSFDLPARTGTVSSDSLRGKIVLVDFWASWCGPCQKSFPWLSTMYDRYSTKGFTIVAISLDKDRVAAEAFLAKHPTPFTVAFDPSGKTAKAYKVWGMPSSFILSPTGSILYSYSGFNPDHANQVEGMIREACAK
jgi:peroxiredoxin